MPTFRVIGADISAGDDASAIRTHGRGRGRDVPSRREAPRNICPNHMVFTFSPSRDVETKKKTLVTKSADPGAELTALEKNQIGIHKGRRAQMLLVASIASCLESILDITPIPNY